MKKTVFIVLICCFSIVSNAGIVGTLSNDKAVKTGRLDNGLRYYLVPDTGEKGFADFYLLRRYVTAMENAQIAGMGVLLDMNALIASPNFPSGQIFDFLDNNGIERVGISTTPLATSHSLLRVPTGMGDAVIDSTLMAMLTIAVGSPVENAGILSSNYLVGTESVDSRVSKALAAELFEGSAFMGTPVVTQISNIKSFSPEQTEAVRRQWSRPDRMAVIVRGRFDAGKMESRIKSVFQMLPGAGIEADTIPTLPPIRSKGFYFFRDREAYCTTIDIHCVSNPLPEKLRTTAMPVMENYLRELFATILERRMLRMADGQSWLPLRMSSSTGHFLELPLDEVNFRMEVSNGNADNAVSFVSNELARLASTGVTKAELEQAKTVYNTNRSRQISALQCIRNFMEGYPIVAPSFTARYIEKADAQVDTAFINRYIRETLSEKERLFFVVSSSREIYPCAEPAGYSLGLPEEDRSLPSDAMLATPKWIESIKWEILQTKNFKRVTVDPVSSAKIWALSNGATVVFRKMDTPDGLMHFEAVSREGLSNMDADRRRAARLVERVALGGIVGGRDYLERKYFQSGLRITLDKNVGLYSKSLKGNFPNSQINAFLGLVRQHFTMNEPDTSWIRKHGSSIDFTDSTAFLAPEKALDLFSSGLGQPEPKVSMEEYLRISEFVRQSYSDASQFTFIFMGPMSEDTLKRAVYDHLFALPSSNEPRSANPRDNIITPPRFDSVNERCVPMEASRAVSEYRVSIPIEYSIRERAVAEVMARVIQRRVVRELSQKGIYATTSLRYVQYPEDHLEICFRFATTTVDNLVDVHIKSAIQKVRWDIPDSEISNVKKAIGLETARRQADPEYWLDLMRAKISFARNTTSGMKEEISKVKGEDIKNMYKDKSYLFKYSMYIISAE